MALAVGVYCFAHGADLPACTINKHSQHDLASVVCSMRMHADIATAADPIDALKYLVSCTTNAYRLAYRRRNKGQTPTAALCQQAPQTVSSETKCHPSSLLTVHQTAPCRVRQFQSPS